MTDSAAVMILHQVTLDCNTWTGTVKMSDGSVVDMEL